MRFIALSTLLALASLAAPASAHDLDGTEVAFEGAVPCAIVCSYWVDNGYTPCEVPFPPGSYVDHVTSPAPLAPGKITVLEGTLDSEIDWDPFFCANDDTRRELGRSAGSVSECDLNVTYIPLAGCHEDLAIRIAAGQTVVFRAYNWFDVAPAAGEYAFLLI